MATPVLQEPATVPAAVPGRSPARWVLGTAVVLVAVQLGLRAWTLSQSWFYWDDLIFTGRGAALPLFSGDLLLHDQDGHLMPGGFLLAAVLTRLAPLDWTAAAASLLVLQALASLALLRLLVRLLGARWLLLVPLVFFLATPLTLPSVAWWAAGLNSLPLQAGLAWVAAEAVALARTGRRRHAVSGCLGYVLTLAFSERGVFAPVVALAVVALVLRADGDPTPLRSARRRASSLWTGALAATVVWAVVYLASVQRVVADGGLQGPVRAALRGIGEGLGTALFGGPWRWDRAAPSTPWADPPLITVALALLAAGAVLRWTVRRRPGARAVWWCAGVYVLASTLVAAVGRSPDWAPSTIALSLRWFADSAVVLAVAVALTLRTPAADGPGTAARLGLRGRRVAVAAGGVLFVASSVFSTVTYTRSAADDRTRDYLTTATAALARAAAVPMLDQEVPGDVLGPLTSPNNLASQVFAPLAERPEIVTSTDDLRVVDDSGEVVPGQVTPTRSVAPGPVADCGYFVTPVAPTTVGFDGALFDWPWTVQLNYVADRDGELTVALGTGQPVQVPVRQGLRSVWVRVVGGEGGLRVTTSTPGMALCVTSGVLGEVEPR